MTTKYFLGLDLGQRRDYTALAVAKRQQMVGRWDPVRMGYPREPRLEFVYVERFAIGTSYVAIAKQVRSMVHNGGVRMAVDGTGVGAGVVDLLRAQGLQAVLWPVTIMGSGGSGTAGAPKGPEGQEYFTVNKTALFYGLRVALEQKRTVFNRRARNMDLVREELLAMGARYSETGVKSVTGATGSQHDDMACAVALAQWAAARVFPGDVRASSDC